MKHAVRNMIIILGLVLLAVGLYLMIAIRDPQGIMLTLPYICLGVVCGLLGHGMGDYVSQRALRNNPEKQRTLQIDSTDERSIAIRNRAKGKVFDIMNYVFGALLLVFALMRIDFRAVLLLVFAYLFADGIFLYYCVKFNKEM